MLTLMCMKCRARVQLVDGTRDGVRKAVAREMGHTMPTVAIALLHVQCPACDQHEALVEVAADE